jgi:hypothetical protein
MSTTSQGTVDQLGLSDILTAGADAGPKVSVYVPTDPTGADGDIARRTLDACLKDAEKQLLATDVTPADVDALLSPLRESVADPLFWREQSRGLALFAGGGLHRVVRVPVEVAGSVTVGPVFHLLPLAADIEGFGRCYILALADNGVRLYESARNSIRELPLGSIPARLDDVVEAPDHELQGRSTGQDTVAFHGHGGPGDDADVLTEEFLRKVADGVEQELGTARSMPLVLACVAEHLPVFRRVCSYPALVDEAIPGNPEHTDPGELRSAAWAIITRQRDARDARARENALTEVHQGRGTTDPAEAAVIAGEGRVDTLLVPRDAVPDDEVVTTALDRALADTLRHGGRLRTLTGTGEDVIATFRG